MPQISDVHSYLPDCSILAKHVIQLFTRDVERQVADIQNAVHFRRKSALKKSDEFHHKYITMNIVIRNK